MILALIIGAVAALVLSKNEENDLYKPFDENEQYMLEKNGAKEYSSPVLVVHGDEGQLLGHIVIGAQMVSEKIREINGFPQPLRSELLHCILAHHGELEYGSPKKPALAEAIALSFADNIDAKMETVKELFSGIPENNTDWLGFNRV